MEPNIPWSLGVLSRDAEDSGAAQGRRGSDRIQWSWTGAESRPRVPLRQSQIRNWLAGGPAGFEPATIGLKVRCSTAELRARLNLKCGDFGPLAPEL